VFHSFGQCEKVAASRLREIATLPTLKPVPSIIAAVTFKGGSGKSSVIAALAAHWLLAGHNPAVIDADPQGTVMGWCQPGGALAGLRVVADTSDHIGATIAALAKDHSPVLVDTPGFRARAVIDALAAADLAVIPCRASPADVPVAVETYRLIQEINATPERKRRPIMARFLLTMTTPGSVIARHVRAQIEEARLPLLKAELASRVAWPEAGLSGDTPSSLDPDSPAAQEIEALARELAKLAKS